MQNQAQAPITINKHNSALAFIGALPDCMKAILRYTIRFTGLLEGSEDLVEAKPTAKDFSKAKDDAFREANEDSEDFRVVKDNSKYFREGKDDSEGSMKAMMDD